MQHTEKDRNEVYMPSDGSDHTSKQRPDQMRRHLWLAVVAAGLVMMAVGIARGEVSTVFLKATNICLECIGIG